MEVKFDLVRIGKIRKNSFAEMILKQNVDFLKNSIRIFLKNEYPSDKHDKISLEMIIPAKGYNIKIALRSVKDNRIKKELRDNFPYSIYKGKDTIIEMNALNRVFGGY
ncbi:hypothetical protein [Flavobacterium sp. UBA4854]|uniref:hypothetical protein n=1 Tax=Flavobacterium sp. UBA4854 TaxID=1946548 RepID=UPI00257C0C28|nr:hypothetical protein [Flavobacterium sp. UBA4854]